MACSPCGIFVGYDQSVLDELKANALLAITSGRRTSLSGGAKSGSKEWKMDPQQMLVEIRYAEQQNGTLQARAQKVVQVLTEYPPQELQ